MKEKFVAFFSDEKIKTGIWYTMLNSCFVYLISFKYFVHLFADVASQHPVYSVAAIISHFTMMSFLPFLCLFLPVYCLSKKYVAAKYATMVVTMVALVVLLIDAYVFSLYRFHINSYVIEQVFGPASGQVFEFTIGQYAMIGGLILLLLLIQYGLFRIAEKLSGKTNHSLFLALGCSWVAVFLFVQCNRFVGLMVDKDRSYISIERHFPLTAPIYPSSMSEMVDCRLNVLNHSYDYPKSTIRSENTMKNLVVIGFDSWRASTMNADCTPNIHRFAQKSLMFKNHESGSNGTRSGVFTLFYGLPGSYFVDFKNQNISSVLLCELQRYNYDCRLYPSASLRNPPLDKNVFYSIENQCDPTEGVNAWRRDVNLMNNFRTYLAERDTSVPFFSFLFFDSLHSMIKPDDYQGPFQPSWNYAKYERLGRNVDPAEFLNLYKNMVYYLDSLTGILLDDLESRGLLENTIVVITGDHSQEFDDNRHGFWGHNGNFSESQIAVPFIYYTPDVQPSEYEHWTSHYDFIPTVMHDLFCVKNPVSDYSIGKDLRDTTERDFLLVDSYIGIGMKDKRKNITNVFYDGTFQITDASLNEDFTSDIDPILWQKSQTLLNSFVRK